MRIIGGFQDTRSNHEDFVITPFLFGVWVNGKVSKVFGLGIGWAYYAFFVGIGFNLTEQYPSFEFIRTKK